MRTRKETASRATGRLERVARALYSVCVDDPTSALNPRQGRRADDESARDRAIGIERTAPRRGAPRRARSDPHLASPG